jgi:hypothetical protein
VNGLPEVTVKGTERQVMDFIEEYLGGSDPLTAQDLFLSATEAPQGVFSVTLDWLPRYDR